MRTAAQHIGRQAEQRAVPFVPQHRARVFADHLLGREAEPLRIGDVGEAAAQLAIPVAEQARYVGRQQPQEGLRLLQPRRRELQFGDPQTGRLFTADLRSETLGGGWRTVTAVGGWWCSPIDAAAFPQTESDPAPRLPPLIPTLTATPAYPLQAIRAAKEGRAVTCFFVKADGLIVQPELIELSDEVFRAPILSALRRSRYQGWEDDGTVRPSCRTYTFKLSSSLHPEVVPGT